MANGKKVLNGRNSVPADRLQRVPELVVDYSEVGRATRFVVPVSAQEHSAMRLQDEVWLVGDSVRRRRARIVGWASDHEVEVELVSSGSASSESGRVIVGAKRRNS